MNPKITRWWLVVSLIVASAAWGRAWNSVEPGVTTEAAVRARFGEPSKITTVTGSDTLVYSKQAAIKGASQVLIRIDQKSRIVSRIDVFPEVVIALAEIEATYGPECAEGETERCYSRRTQERKPSYFSYAKAGLAVFFKDDAVTVKSLVFLPVETTRRARVAIMPFGGPHPRPVQEQISAALCERADCVPAGIVTLDGQPHWPSAIRERVAFLVTGQVIDRGRQIQLMVDGRYGPAMRKVSWPLDSERLTEDDLNEVIGVLTTALGLARDAPPSADETRAQGERKLPGTLGAQTAEVGEAKPGPSASQQAPAETTASFADHKSLTGRDYHAVYVTEPMRIDGVLDEPIWQRAPIDQRFLSAYSKPMGEPTRHPTAVQVAFDEKYLYVAFRNSYETPPPPSNWLPANERAFVETEMVYVMPDSKHDHTNHHWFAVGRTGFKMDAQVIDRTLNVDWRAVWQANASVDGDHWTAEFAIPWGSMGMPAHDGPFTLGMNFVRFNPQMGEDAVWSIFPGAATDTPKPSHFGHLEIDRGVKPDGRVFLAPSLTALYDQSSSTNPFLRNFVGLPGPFGAYAGLFARLRPVTGLDQLEFDLTLNPDFADTPPNPTQVQLNRFELFYPELRQFFLEDRSLFEFGSSSLKLFYSRRLGIRSGGQEVPLLFGAKVVAVHKGTFVGVMDAASTPTGALTLENATNATIMRVNHSFGGQTRLGAIAMNRADAVGLSSFRALGLDGSYALLDEHLVLSGFLAATQATALDATGSSATTTGLGGYAAVDFVSQQIAANVSYQNQGVGFAPQLGYAEIPNSQRTDMGLTYTPQLHSDLVRTVAIRPAVSRVTDAVNRPIVDQQTLTLTTALLSNANLALTFTHRVDTVASAFSIGAGRLMIPAGQFDSVLGEVSLATPPGQTVGVGLGYLEGNYFGGYERIPRLDLSLRLGGFTGTTGYKLVWLKGPDATTLLSHVLSLRAFYAFTADARTSLSIDANTLDGTAVAQLLFSWTFGNLSTLSIVISDRPQSTATLAVPNVQALVKFSYGIAAL